MEEQTNIFKRIVVIIIAVTLFALLMSSCVPTVPHVLEEKDVAVAMKYTTSSGTTKDGYWISKERFSVLAEKAIEYDYLMQNSEANKQLIYNYKNKPVQVVQPAPVIPKEIVPTPKVEEKKPVETKIITKPNF